MTSKELYDQITEQFELLRENFEKADNKSAQGRARIAAGEIKKLITPFRKASVNESKR